MIEHIEHRTYGNQGRTHGRTADCRGCRYWSEMIAKGVNDEIQALCLSPRTPEATHAMDFVAGSQTCQAWASGYRGPVDDPNDDDPRKYPKELTFEVAALLTTQCGHVLSSEGARFGLRRLYREELALFDTLDAAVRAAAQARTPP